ncbi:hypothetical protein D3C72_1437040 [compost metagenome]
MFGRAQDAFGVALLKGLGTNRFGVTPGLVDAITSPTLSLSLQRVTSTRGGNVLARQMCIARLGEFSQGSDRVEHVAPPKRKELYRAL